jgi:uncharacterized cupin superfamily protein
MNIQRTPNLFKAASIAAAFILAMMPGLSDRFAAHAQESKASPPARAGAPRAGAGALQANTPHTTSPVRVDRTKVSGLGLDPSPMSFDPTRAMSMTTQYADDQLSVRIMESNSLQPGSSTCLKMEDFPSDAVITVLNGRLALTDSKGLRQEFIAGDSVILPKGFTGTWEDFGVYRHLIVMGAGAPPKLQPCSAAKDDHAK